MEQVTNETVQEYKAYVLEEAVETSSTLSIKTTLNFK